MKLVILVLSVLLSLPFAALAETPTPGGVVLQQLMQIKTDQGNKISLSAMLDKQGNLAGIHANLGNGDDAGDFTSDGVFWLKDIESNKGVTLVEKGKIDVLKLQGELNRTNQEGGLVIKYITNGIFGSYKACNISVRKTDDKYEVLNAKKKPVSSVVIQTGSVGIKALKGLCS